MELDARELKHLLRIAECGSFSKAAEALHVSQPALSSSIAALERKVGTRVLERGRFGARLNQAGRALVRHARAVANELAHAAEEVRLRKLGMEGPLLVGATPVAAAGLVPAALARLKRSAPDLSASVLEEGVHDEHTAALVSGELDLVVGPIGIYPVSPAVVEERLAADPLCVVLRPNHKLAGRNRLSIRDLAHADWALPSERSAYRRQLEALFVTAGMQWPSRCIATNSMPALKALAMRTDCVAIMPRRLVALECKVRRLVAIALRESGFTRSLGIKWCRDREPSPLAQRFAEELRAVAKQGW
jgi:DNA-binding transcriptional LysR family regulator